MDATDALALVFLRNAFYKRLHYLAFAVLGLGVLAVAILTITLHSVMKNRTQPIYFATNEVGRLIPIVSVDQPNMTTDEVAAWAIEAVQAAYSYDFLNYRAQLQNAQKYFTNYGWSKYMRALAASNNLLALTSRQQIVVSKVISQPKILGEKLLSGAYAWKFEVPLLVTYFEPPYDDKSSYSNALTVTVVVQRQSILQSNKGLGIVQLIASMATPLSLQPQQISATPTG